MTEEGSSATRALARRVCGWAGVVLLLAPALGARADEADPLLAALHKVAQLIVVETNASHGGLEAVCKLDSQARRIELNTTKKEIEARGDMGNNLGYYALGAYTYYMKRCREFE